MSTPSQEDYLEAIWILTDEKGYARVTDLAERLNISPASASKMVRRLHADGLLTYERYRGFSFTPRGKRTGRLLYARHQILERFLTQLEIGDADTIHRVVEGIEHHFDVRRVGKIERLANYIDEHPEWWALFRDDRDS